MLRGAATSSYTCTGRPPSDPEQMMAIGVYPALSLYP
jgi:hypothetical protein